MTNSTQTTLHSANLNPSIELRASLLLLRMTLIAAESATPARPPLPVRDVNEALALQLIQKIKHPAPTMFADVRVESPQPLVHGVFLEMVNSHAG